MRIYDIYCDASVTNSLRGCCAGALITERGKNYTDMRAIVQPTGTNNSGEAGAILLGIHLATDLKYMNMQQGENQCEFNIFSDSIISIRGIREWMFHWIAAANRNGDYVLRNSSDQPTANQVYFKTVFNHMCIHDIQIHFYHQIGHVDRAFGKAGRHFEKINGINLFRLGLTPGAICAYNNFVDTRTRDLLRDYFEHPTKIQPGVMINPVDEAQYESQGDNMVIPYIIADPPTKKYQERHVNILQDKDLIRRYAQNVFALDYPSGPHIAHYLQ